MSQRKNDIEYIVNKIKQEQKIHGKCILFLAFLRRNAPSDKEIETVIKTGFSDPLNEDQAAGLLYSLLFPTYITSSENLLPTVPTIKLAQKVLLEKQCIQSIVPVLDKIKEKIHSEEIFKADSLAYTLVGLNDIEVIFHKVFRREIEEIDGYSDVNYFAEFTWEIIEEFKRKLSKTDYEYRCDVQLSEKGFLFYIHISIRQGQVSLFHDSLRGLKRTYEDYFNNVKLYKEWKVYTENRIILFDASELIEIFKEIFTSQRMAKEINNLCGDEKLIKSFFSLIFSCLELHQQLETCFPKINALFNANLEKLSETYIKAFKQLCEEKKLNSEEVKQILEEKNDDKLSFNVLHQDQTAPTITYQSIVTPPRYPNAKKYAIAAGLGTVAFGSVSVGANAFSVLLLFNVITVVVPVALPLVIGGVATIAALANLIMAAIFIYQFCQQQNVEVPLQLT